jgi:hypothetical protein
MSKSYHPFVVSWKAEAAALITWDRAIHSLLPRRLDTAQATISVESWLEADLKELLDLPLLRKSPLNLRVYPAI